MLLHFYCLLCTCSFGCFFLCFCHFFIVFRTLLLTSFGKPSVSHRLPPLLLPICPLESPDETPIIHALSRMGVVSISKHAFIIRLQLVKGAELQGTVVEIGEDCICIFRIDVAVPDLLVVSKNSLVTVLAKANLMAAP